MISYKKKVLKNGLTCFAHRDESTALAALNVIYKVGAKNENPEKTGFAHLFEHLMFGGSKNVPEFDIPIQLAAGENNAFTNNDYTDYYIVVPVNNLETALWVESDRMNNLNINNDTLELQKKVVIEEFNQRYLNKPYGDIWMLLRSMAYTKHPYMWSTIGKTPKHIQDATLEDVQSFYNNFYIPSNAIISIASPLPEEEIFELIEKWFGDIEKTSSHVSTYKQEPKQIEARRLEVERDVPASLVYIVYHMDKRLSDEFHVCDLISDILSSGSSSRMHQNLVKKEELFSSINAFISGDVDEGLFVVTGQVAEGVDLKVAEESLLKELEVLKNEKIDSYELQKVKNKFEVNTIFGEINIMNKAMNLCFYEMLGDIDLINNEIDNYKKISEEDIVNTAKKIFTKENSSTLIYKKVE
ncbi:MAG: pitrilysin family protein [Rikenellaceae bacterium]